MEGDIWAADEKALQQKEQYDQGDEKHANGMKGKFVSTERIK